MVEVLLFVLFGVSQLWWGEFSLFKKNKFPKVGVKWGKVKVEGRRNNIYKSWGLHFLSRITSIFWDLGKVRLLHVCMYVWLWL